MNSKKAGDLLRTAARNKWSWVVAGLLIVISVAGILYYEGTKKTVSLTADGKTEEITTHAKTVGEVLSENNIEYKEQDYISPSIETKVKDNLKIVWKPAFQVILNIDGQEKKVWTTAKTVGEFLESENIQVKEHDDLNVSLDTKIKQGLGVKLDVAFQVVVNDGGKESTAWSTVTTVDDFLKEQGIELNELDRVEPGLDEMVSKDTTVNIIRVEKVTDVVEEPIDFAVVTKKTEAYYPENRKWSNKGKRKIQKTYEVVLENGVEVSKTLVKEEVLEKPTDKIVA